MKRYFVILLMLFLIPSSSVLAQTATPSADIQSKLKALQDEIASRAAQIKAQISEKLQNKAYMGKILAQADNTVTVSDPTGTPKVIKITQDTEVLSGGVKTTTKNLGEGDYIAALGDIDDAQVLNAKRIVKYKTPPFNMDTLQEVTGSVSKIEDTKITLKNQDQIYQISTDTKTNFRFGTDTSSISDVKINKPIIVVGIKSNDSIQARFVYILPYTSSLKIKPSPTSSPSAQTTPKPTSTSAKDLLKTKTSQ